MAIVKILARRTPSYASLIRYILDDTKIDKANVFTNNLRSADIDGFVKEFIHNEAFRKQSRSDQVYLFHEIISFHNQENKDLLTTEMIADVLNAYIHLRGDTGVMLGAVHRDKEHVHAHFCVSGLHFRTGKSFGLSKGQLQELKISFQKYHTKHYPELAKSAPEHGGGMPYVHHKEWRAKQRQQVIEKVQNCFALAKSQRDFLELLRNVDLHHYERNGKATGIDYERTKFRFSRLLDGKQFDALPIEQSDEQKALDEIRSIRERQAGRDRADRNMEDIAR